MSSKMTYGEHGSPFGVKDTNEFRAKQGMRPIVQGHKNCLRCDRKFFSENVRVQRMCEFCRGIAKSQRSCIDID